MHTLHKCTLNAYLPNPFSTNRKWHGVSVWVKIWIQSFLFLTIVKGPSLPYYLPVARRRIIGFISFLRVLALSEIQTVSYRIWIRVAVFISYDGNHYITNDSSGDFNRFEISFPSLRTVAFLRLKNLVDSISSKVDSWFSQVYVNCN